MTSTWNVFVITIGNTPSCYEFPIWSCLGSLKAVSWVLCGHVRLITFHRSTEEFQIMLTGLGTLPICKLPTNHNDACQNQLQTPQYSFHSKNLKIFLKCDKIIKCYWTRITIEPKTYFYPVDISTPFYRALPWIGFLILPWWGISYVMQPFYWSIYLIQENQLCKSLLKQ